MNYDEMRSLLVTARRASIVRTRVKAKGLALVDKPSTLV